SALVLRPSGKGSRHKQRREEPVRADGSQARAVLPGTGEIELEEREITRSSAFSVRCLLFGVPFKNSDPQHGREFFLQRRSYFGISVRSKRRPVESRFQTFSIRRTQPELYR